MKISDKEFENMVKEGLDLLPERFLKKLKNVAVVVSFEPSLQQKKELGLRSNSSLFGLYEGVPQTERGSFYSALPDKITIFKKPILDFAADRQEAERLIHETVWHEVAHHFGLNEQEVRAREKERNRLGRDF